MSYVRRFNGFVDKSCSLLVSFAVVGVNLYYFPWDGNVQSIATPVFTSACCATAALSKVLKRIVNQSRPAGAAKLSPGMPSNHATALSFLSVVACVGLNRGQVLSDSSLLFSQACLMGYGLYATGLRVACGHHTWPQVLVGYGLGSAAAAGVLRLNYGGYSGSLSGGRIDEAPRGAKAALLAASVAVCVLALRSVVKGLPLLEKKTTRA